MALTRGFRTTLLERAQRDADSAEPSGNRRQIVALGEYRHAEPPTAVVPEKDARPRSLLRRQMVGGHELGGSRSTGSSSRSLHSSIRIIVATAVIGLVIEAMRKIVSRRFGSPPPKGFPGVR